MHRSAQSKAAEARYPSYSGGTAYFFQPRQDSVRRLRLEVDGLGAKRV